MKAYQELAPPLPNHSADVIRKIAERDAALGFWDMRRTLTQAEEDRRDLLLVARVLADYVRETDPSYSRGFHAWLWALGSEFGL